MQTATHHSAQVRTAATGPAFSPLHLEARPTVDTAAAAHYLLRRPQTFALAAVISVADSVRGEVPKALVVLKVGQAAGPELAAEIQALHERQAVKRASAPASASIDG